MTEEGERKKRKQQEGKRTVDEKKKNKKKKKKEKKEKPGSCRAVVRLQSERSLLGVVKVTYCL